MDVRDQISELLATLQRDGQAPDARAALDRLIPLVYDQLRVMAHRQLGSQRVGHTLSTTALVHEAYDKLVNHTRVAWRDGGHFFAAAAVAMRHILVDHARRHTAAKRSGAYERVPLGDAMLGDGVADDALLAADDNAELLLALDEALTRLAALDPRLSRVVELQFFGGLSDTEIAELLHVTTRTVERDRKKAKAWLRRELEAWNDGHGGGDRPESRDR